MGTGRRLRPPQDHEDLAPCLPPRRPRLGLYPSCTDGKQGARLDLSGPAPAAAKAPRDAVDPNFLPYDDAVPGEYVVTFAPGAYTPPTDPDAGGGAQTNSAVTAPTYPISDDGSDAPAVAQAVCGDYGATPVDAFDYAGSFSATMTETQARAMSHDARVQCVESDANTYCATVYKKPGWGLDRIDQTGPLRPGQGPPNDQYTCNAKGGASDVDAWVVDTGIWSGSSDLTGRVVAEFPNSKAGAINSCADLHPTKSTVKYTSSDDDYGHGSVVASVFGGTKWGAAKGVKFHAVKVADNSGQGTVSSLLAGLNYIQSIPAVKGRRSVVNISQLYLPGTGKYDYTSPQSTSIGTAMTNLIAKGIVVVVCAGNNSEDVETRSTMPAMLSLTNPGLITVGASSYYSDNSTPAFDLMFQNSNWGRAVTLFAPGEHVGIHNVDYDSTTKQHTQNDAIDSGTSLSSPYVAGVIAMILETNPGYTPAQAKQAIVNSATPNMMHISSQVSATTPNLLLFTNGL